MKVPEFINSFKSFKLFYGIVNYNNLNEELLLLKTSKEIEGLVNKYPNEWIEITNFKLNHNIFILNDNKNITIIYNENDEEITINNTSELYDALKQIAILIGE